MVVNVIVIIPSSGESIKYVRIVQTVKYYIITQVSRGLGIIGRYVVFLKYL